MTLFSHLSLIAFNFTNFIPCKGDLDEKLPYIHDIRGLRLTETVTLGYITVRITFIFVQILLTIIVGGLADFNVKPQK